jgi:hypothetical protein
MRGLHPRRLNGSQARPEIDMVPLNSLATGDAPIAKSRLTHSEADKRHNEARFARYYMIRLQLS